MFGDFEFTPGLLLSMWAAGTAGGAAVVAWWRIVGPGYTWLTAGTVVGLGGSALFFGRSIALQVGVVCAVAALFLGRRHRHAALLLGIATAAFLWEAITAGSVLLALTGSVALGGITAEMLLGHWYLVSPQLPRWALQRLDVAGAAGMAADTVLLVVAGALAAAGSTLPIMFWGLAGMSVLLMVAVWFALKEPSYPGVMAATGLSYLAVLTALGATALGRTLLDGSSGFLPFE